MRPNLKIWLVIAALLSVIALPAHAGADPNLVGWWKLDEGKGGIVYDSAGTNHGTLQGNPQWVAGRIGDYALSFDGNGDYISYGDILDNEITNAFTIGVWVKSGGVASWKTFNYILWKEDDRPGIRVNYGGTVTFLHWHSGAGSFFTSSHTLEEGRWYHISYVFNGSDFIGYINAEYTGSISDSGYSPGGNLQIADDDDYRRSFYGVIDDVRIYNRALSAEEIRQLYWEGSGKAFYPYPANGAVGVDPDVILRWRLGKYALSHDVYFGTDYNDVNNATVDSSEYKGNFDVNSYDPNGLELYTTYYWRIDEVNGPNVWKGNVWRFETGRPVIELSAVKFWFHALWGGANPDSQILTIKNAGFGTLDWEISYDCCDCNWLEVDHNSGSLTSGMDEEVTLSVNIDGLAPGGYNCELIISDPCIEDSPQTVAVNLFVGTKGLLLVPLEYPTIQAAINASVPGDTVIVAPGTYTGDGNRDLNFLGKAITVQSINPNDPNVVAATVVDCQGSKDNHRGGFRFLSGETNMSILDGFTITNGYADGGAGISCLRSSPTIRNCNITGNKTIDYYPGWGGGICVRYSAANIINCKIAQNWAEEGGGIFGFYAQETNIHNCTINNNTASIRGGGLYFCESTPFIINCTFSGNSANKGGGIYNNVWSDLTVTNCTFSSNSANEGGGIYNNERGDLTVTNCTFIANSATADGGGMCNYGSSPTVTNCIFRADVPSEIYGGDPAVVTYSCVQGGWTGIGNINADPCFVDPDSNDFHLLPNSPCINTGDPNFIAKPNETDIDDEQRVMLGRVDMGADEFNPFEVTFDVVDKRRIGRTVFEYDCNVTLTNISRFVVRNVQLEIVKASNNMVIIEPNVAFGDVEIGAGQSAISIDTCTFQVDRSQAIEPAEITWRSRCDLVAISQTLQHNGSSIIFLEQENIIGDLTGDGKVNFEDLKVLAEQWLGPPGVPSADIAPPGGDGIVNFLDFAKLAENWGQL